MSYTDFETKKTFVKQLGRLISTMYPQIAALEYHQHESDEVVIIRHQDGYTRRVDVTATISRTPSTTLSPVYAGGTAMRKMPYTGRERRQRALYRATMALWMLAVILLAVVIR